MTSLKSTEMAWVAVPGMLLAVGSGACGAGGQPDSTNDAVKATMTETAPVNLYGDAMPHPTVTLTTSLGDIRLELFPENAPVTVENFLAYVASGYYDGLIFHRVIPGFMVQAGGHSSDMAQREASLEAIRNESDNGLHNLRGTVSMARTGEPHSARAQFFINLVDNANLDHRGAGAWGYAVFGRVIGGIDVVDVIATKPTAQVGPHANVPIEPVMIESAVRGEDIQPED